MIGSTLTVMEKPELIDRRQCPLLGLHPYEQLGDRNRGGLTLIPLPRQDTTTETLVWVLRWHPRNGHPLHPCLSLVPSVSPVHPQVWSFLLHVVPLLTQQPATRRKSQTASNQPETDPSRHRDALDLPGAGTHTLQGSSDTFPARATNPTFNQPEAGPSRHRDALDLPGISTQDLRDIAPAPAEHHGEKINVPDYKDLVYQPMTQPEVQESVLELISKPFNSDQFASTHPSRARVPGFKRGVRLNEHQMRSRSWLKSRENHLEKHFGGILADDMG